MTADRKEIRALGLCSGGLDSILAGLTLRRQDVAVAWVAFETPFFSAGKALKASAMHSIPLRVVDITDVYVDMLRDPRCGYGQNMNPCLDCHALMFRSAAEFLKPGEFDFLFSGEVLGQRPMSQTGPSLRYVEKHSGAQGYILRPLSARLLPETIPEEKGWVDRSRLLDIAGRSRKRQIQLAAEWGVTDYPAPAGGCLLTDKGYSRRLRDLFAHQDAFSRNELLLLRHGRHFRVDKQSKFVVGRSQADNEQITSCYDAGRDSLIRLKSYPGPVALLPGGGSRGAVMLAAAVTAGYGKVPSETLVNALVVSPHGEETVTVIAVAPADVKHLLL